MKHSMIGMRCGMLTVIGRASRPADYTGQVRGSWWECRCDCGKTRIAPRQYLTSKTISSCGCIRGAKAPGERAKTPEEIRADKVKAGKVRAEQLRGKVTNFRMGGAKVEMNREDCKMLERIGKKCRCSECGKTFDRLSADWVYKTTKQGGTQNGSAPTHAGGRRTKSRDASTGIRWRRGRQRGEKMARKYRVRMGAFDIGKWEFQEVEALARRYPAMKRRANVLEKCNATGVHGEAYTAILWECSIVDEALKATGGGEWAKALEQSCCHGVPYVDIDPADMPTSNKNDFARARREFYWRLWTLRQKKLGCAVKGEKNEPC